MRIRSIKPEFWGHPVMSRQSDATKLLAVGLLNLADDEGYFYAEPTMVRNSLRPHDENSGITTVSLRELSEIGFVSVQNHPTHGLIGKVVSFAEHQVINKPKASKIKDLWASGIATVSIPDASRLEGKGKEQGKEGIPPNPQGGDGGKISDKKTDNIPTTPQALRIGELFRRKPTTAWSHKEVRAYKALGKIDPEDLEMVCRYTESERAKGHDGRHRRDLATFLNNFTGELDRARAKPINGHGQKRELTGADVSL